MYYVSPSAAAAQATVTGPTVALSPCVLGEGTLHLLYQREPGRRLSYRIFQSCSDSSTAAHRSTDLGKDSSTLCPWLKQSLTQYSLHAHSLCKAIQVSSVVHCSVYNYRVHYYYYIKHCYYYRLLRLKVVIPVHNLSASSSTLSYSTRLIRLYRAYSKSGSGPCYPILGITVHPLLLLYTHVEA